MSNFHRIDTCNMVNGTGCRVVIWLSGCPHHCHGCFSPQTWHPNSGKEFTEDDFNTVFNALQETYCSGITLLGGDPLAPYNLNISVLLAKCAKDLGKNVWCYTGYAFEHVKDLEVMKYIDVLVDGHFDIHKFNSKLKWRGSANQRIILVQESLEQDKIVLHKDNNTVNEYFPEQAEDPCKGMTREEIKEKYIDNVAEE